MFVFDDITEITNLDKRVSKNIIDTNLSNSGTKECPFEIRGSSD